MSNAQEKLLNTIGQANKVRSTVELEDGTKVDIYACQVRHVGLMVKTVQMVLEEFKVSTMGEAMDHVGNIEGSLENPQKVLQLIANAEGPIWDLAISLCNVNADEFQLLEIDDAIKIVMEEVEVNKSFFTQRVLPVLSPILSSFGKKDPQSAESSTAEETTSH